MKRFFALFLSTVLLLSTAVGCGDVPAEMPQQSPSGDGLTVHFIDVGQADAALIECDGEAMLIDGGNVADSDLIYAYLKQEGIEELKYIVGTHAHEDHMGGLAGALEYAAVDTFFAPTAEADTKFFENDVKLLARQGKEITIPDVGSSYSLGTADFQFVGPIFESDNKNNMSLVLRLAYGDTSFLFTGDAEAEEEEDILDAGFDISADVLKVGHHGSNSSTTYRFLREVSPTYGVISCGVDNSYGHPHDEPLSRLRDADVELYRTDLQGTILCESDGENLTFSTAKNPTVETNPSQGQSDGAYIGNANSKVFHRPDCSGLPKEENRIYFESRMEAVDQGYTPCGRCKP